MKNYRLTNFFPPVFDFVKNYKRFWNISENLIIIQKLTVVNSLRPQIDFLIKGCYSLDKSAVCKHFDGKWSGRKGSLVDILKALVAAGSSGLQLLQHHNGKKRKHFYCVCLSKFPDLTLMIDCSLWECASWQYCPQTFPWTERFDRRNVYQQCR